MGDGLNETLDIASRLPNGMLWALGDMCNSQEHRDAVEEWCKDDKYCWRDHPVIECAKEECPYGKQYRKCIYHSRFSNRMFEYSKHQANEANERVANLERQLKKARRTAKRLTKNYRRTYGKVMHIDHLQIGEGKPAGKLI